MKTCFMLVLAFACFTLLPTIHGYVLSYKVAREEDVSPDIPADEGPVKTVEDAVIFMKRFGFLERQIEAPANYSKSDRSASSEIADGLSHYQALTGLRESGVLDSETREMMNKPQCGVSSLATVIARKQRLANLEVAENAKRFKLVQHTKKSGQVITLKFKKNELTYKFGSYTPDMSISEQEKELAIAFEKWAAVSALSFKQVKKGDKSDITIDFLTSAHGDKFPFDGSLPKGTVAAHAFFPRKGKLHFDDDEKFLPSTKEGGPVDIYLRMVALHEIGHLLGINHSEEPDAVMAPKLRSVKNMELTEDDISAIQTLYGSKKGKHVLRDIIEK